MKGGERGERERGRRKEEREVEQRVVRVWHTRLGRRGG